MDWANQNVTSKWELEGVVSIGCWALPSQQQPVDNYDGAVWISKWQVHTKINRTVPELFSKHQTVKVIISATDA